MNKPLWAGTAGFGLFAVWAMATAIYTTWLPGPSALAATDMMLHAGTVLVPLSITLLAVGTARELRRP